LWNEPRRRHHVPERNELLTPPLTKRFGFANQKDPEEAEAFTCKGCTGKYTDGSGSGSGTMYNCGYCSSECREAAKKAPRHCEHGRRKSRCKDCSAGYCQHGRRKSQCKDCGAGYCQHGRQKSQCRDCGACYCKHGRLKSRCKDCGPGHCQHGRQRGRCMEC
jgi:hypothetical protein